MDEQGTNQGSGEDQASEIKGSEAYIEFFKFIFDKTIAYIGLFMSFFTTPVSAWESVREKEEDFKDLQKNIILPIAVISSVLALFFNLIQGRLSYALSSSIMAFFTPFIAVYIFHFILSKADGYDFFKYRSTPQGNIKLSVYSLIVPLFPFATAIYALFGDSTSISGGIISTLVGLGLGIYGIYILIKGLDILADCKNKPALVATLLISVGVVNIVLYGLVGSVFL